MAFTDSIKWNGKSLRDYFAEITDVKGRGKPRVNVKGISIPGRHGQMAFKQTYKPRIIEIEGTVEGTSHSNLMSNIDNLKSLFAMEDELLPTRNRTISDGMEYGRLEFGDESGRYYNAVFDGIFDLPEISHRWMSNDIKRFRARFRCDEPFAVASAFDFTAPQRNAAFQLVENVVLKPRFAVSADGPRVRILLFHFLFLGHQQSPRAASRGIEATLSMTLSILSN